MDIGNGYIFVWFYIHWNTWNFNQIPISSLKCQTKKIHKRVYKEMKTRLTRIHFQIHSHNLWRFYINIYIWEKITRIRKDYEWRNKPTNFHFTKDETIVFLYSLLFFLKCLLSSKYDKKVVWMKDKNKNNVSVPFMHFLYVFTQSIHPFYYHFLNSRKL